MRLSRFLLLTQIHFMQLEQRSFSSARVMLDEMSDTRIKSNKKTFPGHGDHALDTAPCSVKPTRHCHITFIHLLSNCIRLNDILAGRIIHCSFLKSGFSSNHFLGTTLLDLYAKCGFVQHARQVFDDISTRDIVLWNVLVSCYALNGMGELSFEVFGLMRLDGYAGDGFTFSSLLNSCCLLGYIQLGKQTHGLVIKLSFESDIVVGTSLVDMYAKCGDIEDAYRAFDFLEVRNVVSWNALIVGFARKGEGKEAIKLFTQMLCAGLKPDELTLASVLSSCADSAAAGETTQVHNYVVKNGFKAYSSVGNALICAYAKSGYIHSAHQVFGLISHPDLVTWSSMLSSFAFHGLAHEAVDVFERMLHEGVRPDRIAFIGVLSACSHAGLLETGLHYFSSMRKEYGIEAGSEHYACLVDLLARSGHLHEARDVITNMPFEPGGDVLGAFIGACKVHGKIGLARWAADRLFRLEPDEPVNYLLISNSYAALGCWDNVAKVRKIMTKRCGYKVPGFSWIEIDVVVHTFVSSDRSHRQDPEIHFLLGLLIGVMKDEWSMPEVMLRSDELGN